MSQPEPNFAELIERAQSVDGDVAGPFAGASGGRVAFQPGRAPGVPSYDYEPHADVFFLPGDKEKYEEVLSLLLSGEAIRIYEEKTFTKDGDFAVAVAYMTPRQRAGAPAVVGEAGDQEPPDQHEKLA